MIHSSGRTVWRSTQSMVASMCFSSSRTGVIITYCVISPDVSFEFRGPETRLASISCNLVRLQRRTVSLKQGYFLGVPVHALFDPLAAERSQLFPQVGRIKQSAHLVGEIDGIVWF